MNQNGYTPRRRRVVDYAAAAVEQMEHYCVEHPGSPSAVRRPQLFFRCDLWIALLGPNVEEGIVGSGKIFYHGRARIAMRIKGRQNKGRNNGNGSSTTGTGKMEKGKIQTQTGKGR